MVVAVPFVRMMQMTVHQVIHMIAVRHPLMTAVWSMKVGGFVRAAIVLRCAAIGILGSSREFMVVDMVAVYVVQVPIVQIVGMAIVLNSSVAAICTVPVCMSFVLRTGGCHNCLHLGR